MTTTLCFSTRIISTISMLCVLAIASPAQTFDSLVSFDYSDGELPAGALVQGRNGSFYGTTSQGGANNGGTVFEITPEGELQTLYNFCSEPGCIDGASPYSGLILGTNGNFYGTTAGGGIGSNCAFNGCGTIFRITPEGKLTTLYSFCSQSGCPDGATPIGLVQAANGNFYGMTYYGGANEDSGTVYEITPQGKLTTIYSFCAQSNCLDGRYPDGVLLQARNGNFFGTTSYGGSANSGSVFEINGSGNLTTLYSFCTQAGCSDGQFPIGGLIQASDGNLYGTTSFGGAYMWGGTFFKVTNLGKLTTLYSFCARTNCTDGQYPLGALVQATDGNFYGTTSEGGAGALGTIFKMNAAGQTGQLTTLHSFCLEENCIDGRSTSSGLCYGTGGSFYGTTYQGGTYGYGTVFSLEVGFGPFVTFVQATGKVGATAEILGQSFKGTTDVSFNGTSANFVVRSDTFLTATVPAGATTGYVSVTTPTRTLTSNVTFRVIP
jgi:uncharacterized repeat protein (TIGR03803 family)